uniref:transcription factor E2F8-like isoform X2 n=1 Tax=Myxine glutinosa TaxID=7769 RepID=UPI00358F58B2
MPACKMTSLPVASRLRREGISAVADWSQNDLQTLSQQQSRKDKSLGLLSLRFLRNLPSQSDAATGRQIYVDNMASVLGVERRRIYDVVNVLESLALLSRVAKNCYCWHGPQAMQQALEQLGAPEEEGSNFSSCPSPDSSQEPWPTNAETGLSPRFPRTLRGGRKEKSLRTLSQRFVMLFLTSGTKSIDLDTAASSIINQCSPCSAEDEKQFKTTVRRLYDIANILSSLGLLRKTPTVSGGLRRPTFEWVGPSGLTDAHVPHDASPVERESTALQKTLKSMKKNNNKKKPHPSRRTSSQPAGASPKPGLVPVVAEVEQGQSAGAREPESPVPGETTPTCPSNDLIGCESKANYMLNTRVEDCDGEVAKEQFCKILGLCRMVTTNSEGQPESKRRCICLPHEAPQSTKVPQKERPRPWVPNAAANQKAIVQHVLMKDSAYMNDTSCTTNHENVTRPVIWVPIMPRGEVPGHDVRPAYSCCATLPRVQQGSRQGRICPERRHNDRSTSDTCTSSTSHHYRPPPPLGPLNPCPCQTDSAPESIPGTGWHGVLSPCGAAGLFVSPQWVPAPSALWILTPQLTHVMPSLPKRSTADRMH